MFLPLSEAAAAVLSPSDLPNLATGLGFAVLIAAGVFWLRLARSPDHLRSRQLGMAAGSTGVAFVLLGAGWFLPGLV